MTLVDAHVHLPEVPSVKAMVEGMRGICMFSCTVNLGQVETNLRLSEDSKGLVRCFVGVHPSEVTDDLPGEHLSRFMERADGLGEIGLDPKYSESGKGSRQMKAFLDQLSLAERYGKPVQIHSRGSEGACLEVLGTFRLRSVLMHWFEGDEESATQLAISRGYYFSLGPALLYSKKIRRLAQRVPQDRLLTESDGPVPFNALGGASGPNLIASVVFKLGEVRLFSFEEAERVVEENSRSFLGAERLI